MTTLPRTEEEIDAFLDAFDRGTLPKQRWTHEAHVLTGACYVHSLGQAAATDKMRLSVRRYNEAVGGKNTETSGYHETITVGWIKLMDRLLRETPQMARAAFAALAVQRFGGDRDLLQRYYSFELPGSVEARRRWIPPTLVSLD